MEGGATPLRQITALGPGDDPPHITSRPEADRDEVLDQGLRSGIFVVQTTISLSFLTSHPTVG